MRKFKKVVWDNSPRGVVPNMIGASFFWLPNLTILIWEWDKKMLFFLLAYNWVIIFVVIGLMSQTRFPKVIEEGKNGTKEKK